MNRDENHMQNSIDAISFIGKKMEDFGIHACCQ